MSNGQLLVIVLGLIGFPGAIWALTLVMLFRPGRRT